MRNVNEYEKWRVPASAPALIIPRHKTLALKHSHTQRDILRSSKQAEFLGFGSLKLVSVY